MKGESGRRTGEPPPGDVGGAPPPPAAAGDRPAAAIWTSGVMAAVACVFAIGAAFMQSVLGAAIGGAAVFGFSALYVYLDVDCRNLPEDSFLRNAGRVKRTLMAMACGTGALVVSAFLVQAAWNSTTWERAVEAFDNFAVPSPPGEDAVRPRAPAHRGSWRVVILAAGEAQTLSEAWKHLSPSHRAHNPSEATFIATIEETEEEVGAFVVGGTGVPSMRIDYDIAVFDKAGRFVDATRLSGTEPWIADPEGELVVGGDAFTDRPQSNRQTHIVYQGGEPSEVRGDPPDPAEVARGVERLIGQQVRR